MALTEDDVRKVATLARLDLSDADITRMTSELGTIVGYIEQLSEVDTDGVEPIANVAGLQNITRADQPGTMLPVDRALTNAPHANTNAFLVPKAVER